MTKNTKNQRKNIYVLCIHVRALELHKVSVKILGLHKLLFVQDQINILNTKNIDFESQAKGTHNNLIRQRAKFVKEAQRKRRT